MKEFKMLIGDDAFTDDGTVEDIILNILTGISSVTKIPFTEGEIIDGVYYCKNFPLPQFDEAKITFVNSVEAMITEAKKYNFDWIVTDLNYGQGYEMGGVQVANGLINNSAITALFTSDFIKDMDVVKSVNFDCVISQTGATSKTVLLGQTIGKHYMEKKISYLESAIIFVNAKIEQRDKQFLNLSVDKLDRLAVVLGKLNGIIKNYTTHAIHTGYNLEYRKERFNIAAEKIKTVDAVLSDLYIFLNQTNDIPYTKRNIAYSLSEYGIDLNENFKSAEKMLEAEKVKALKPLKVYQNRRKKILDKINEYENSKSCLNVKKETLSLIKTRLVEELKEAVKQVTVSEVLKLSMNVIFPATLYTEIKELKGVKTNYSAYVILRDDCKISVTFNNPYYISCLNNFLTSGDSYHTTDLKNLGNEFSIYLSIIKAMRELHCDFPGSKFTHSGPSENGYPWGSFHYSYSDGAAWDKIVIEFSSDDSHKKGVELLAKKIIKIAFKLSGDDNPETFNSLIKKLDKFRKTNNTYKAFCLELLTLREIKPSGVCI